VQADEALAFVDEIHEPHRPSSSAARLFSCRRHHGCRFLNTLTLSGAQLLQVLEQQWLGQPRPRVLQVSRGLAYTWDAARPPGQRVLAGSLRLNGQPLALDARLRVTVNSYLAAGGDNFIALKAGTQASNGMMDIDALELFLQQNPLLAPMGAARIERLN